MKDFLIIKGLRTPYNTVYSAFGQTSKLKVQNIQLTPQNIRILLLK